MNQILMPEQLQKVADTFEDGYDYLIDSSQRSVLFWDIIRKRGKVILITSIWDCLLSLYLIMR